MNDFDRLIGDSLKAVGEDFRAEDVGAAQREFMSRRRRRFSLQLVAGVVVAGAAVAAVLLLSADAPQTRSDDVIPPAGGLSVLGTVAVGDEPIAISIGRGVWVANSGDSTVTYIDPETGDIETIDVPTANEIAVGAANAWVGGDHGRYVRIDAYTREITWDGNADELGDVEDIAVGGTSAGAAWMVLSDGCVFEATIPALIPDDCDFGDGFRPTDVATDGGETYLLDQATGRLYRLHSDAAPDANGTPPFSDRGLPSGEYGDLLNDFVGGLWVSGEGGNVTRVDLATGERVEFTLDGDYTDLAVGPGFVWALAGVEGGDTATLYRLDGKSGEVLGSPLELDGKPSDLAGNGHEAWVTLRAKDEVIRVGDGEENPAPAPVATSTPTPIDSPSPETNAKAKSTVMVFSKDGDIWAAYGDGTIEPLTETQEAESNPVFVHNTFNPKYPAILFERTSGASGSDLAYLDLKTMKEQPIIPGSKPATNPLQAAWIEAGAAESRVGVGILFSEPSASLDVVSDGESVGAYRLAWDAGGRFIYALSASDAQTVISMDSTGELGEISDTAGDERHYIAIATSDQPDSVDVVTACCSASAVKGSAWDSYEIGTITGWGAGTGGGNTYAVRVDISSLPLTPDPAGFNLTPANGLSASPNEDGTVTWGPSDAPGWIVSDGVRAFLVDADGAMQELPFEVHGGMDVYEQRSL